MKDNGVTLIELLVVLGIIGLLVIAMGFSYEGWMGNYRIESQTKELYFDLSDARSSALTRNRIHWAVLDAQQYTIFEDTNPPPDGDGILDNQDTQVRQRRYEYGYRLGVLGAAALPQTIAFDTRGLISWVPAVNDMRFRFINTRDPDYDCIVIEQSRMWMGEYDPATIVCERR
jgi:prepilin-type N-terminal cleavage/methylation domain-containing protein